MAAYKVVRVLLFTLFVTTWFFAQVIPQHSPQAATAAPEKVPLEKVPLAVVSTVQVPSLPMESMALPVLCSPEGTIFIRLATMAAGVQDTVSVSSDGKTVIRFDRMKINDVPRPVPLDVFLSGSDVYMLTDGQIPLGYETKWRSPIGEVESHQASTSRTFVTHFQHDGTYAGSVLLDVPFKPLHLGIFEDGNFLITGADKKTDEPRLAIVSSSGQFMRFVELKGDVHAQKESDVSQKDKDQDKSAMPHFAPDKNFGNSLIDVVYTSQIVGDGSNLLLFRRSNSPVFSISSGGEVRAQKLKVQGGYSLENIKTTRDSWIAEFTHGLRDGTGNEFATYAFDPYTGAPLRQYIYPRDLGFGLACTDGVEFTFVMADTESKSLKLLKLAPATRPN
jgi:hypothetical protein